jgi:hypothetical protein
LARVRHIGTGTLLVQKRVFRDLAERHSEWKYLVDTSYFFGRPNPDRDFQYDFFQTKIDPETKNYVCEDQFFNDAAREIGYESYARLQLTGLIMSELSILFVIYPWSARIRERPLCDRGEVKCLFTDVFRKQTPPHPRPQRSSFWMIQAEPFNTHLRGQSSRNRIIGACRFSVRMGVHQCRFRLAPCFRSIVAF